MERLSKDSLTNIALRLKLKDLESFCSTNKRFFKICSDPHFWRYRIMNKFPEYYDSSVTIKNLNEYRKYIASKICNLTLKQNNLDDCLTDNLINNLDVYRFLTQNLGIHHNIDSNDEIKIITDIALKIKRKHGSKYFFEEAIFDMIDSGLLDDLTLEEVVHLFNVVNDGWMYHPWTYDYDLDVLKIYWNDQEDVEYLIDELYNMGEFDLVKILQDQGFFDYVNVDRYIEDIEDEIEYRRIEEIELSDPRYMEYEDMLEHHDMLDYYMEL